MNQKDTNLREMSFFWSLQLAPKQREIVQALSDSIKLDKQVFDLSSSSFNFFMLRSFFSNPFPSVIRLINQTFTSDYDTVNRLGFYFNSVFTKKQLYYGANVKIWS